VKISVSRSAALRESAGSQDHMQITIEVVIFHIATSPANARNSSAKMIISVKKREKCGADARRIFGRLWPHSWGRFGVAFRQMYVMCSLRFHVRFWSAVLERFWATKAAPKKHPPKDKNQQGLRPAPWRGFLEK